jgi:hypothetical protein
MTTVVEPVMRPVRALSRGAVEATLTMYEVPLTVTEILVRRSGQQWPPRVVFTSVEAWARRTVGDLVGDEELARRGRHQAVAVAELRDATDLEARAAVATEEAERTLEQRLEAADRRREAAESQARTMAGEADRAAQARKAATEKSAEQREEQVLDQAAAESEVREKAKRAAALKASEDQAEALAEGSRALAARAAILQAEQQVNEAKAKRSGKPAPKARRQAPSKPRPTKATPDAP